MKRCCIDGDVAGQIVDLPIGIVHGDGPGESISTGLAAGRICERGLVPVRGDLSGGQSIRKCIFLGRNPGPLRS
jgi:hypothetical protein